MDETNQQALELTAGIVAAFVSNNSVRPVELSDLIASVHASIASLRQAQAVDEPAAELKPAVPVKKSITDDFLICLDDGKKFKTLRRHLAQLGMTPEEYRAKWALPSDYPMVAPGYAAKRSELAQATGLGSTRRAVSGLPKPAGDSPATQDEADVAAEPEASPPSEAAEQPVKKSRSRKKKSV